MVRKELELKNTQLLWETAKLSEAEAKLHKCEQEKAKYVNESTKTRMKLQEVKEKENDCKLNCNSVIFYVPNVLYTVFCIVLLYSLILRILLVLECTINKLTF